MELQDIVQKNIALMQTLKPGSMPDVINQESMGSRMHVQGKPSISALFVYDILTGEIAKFYTERTEVGKYGMARFDMIMDPKTGSLDIYNIHYSDLLASENARRTLEQTPNTWNTHPIKQDKQKKNPGCLDYVLSFLGIRKKQ